MYKVVVNKNILVLLFVFLGGAFLLSGCLVSNNPQRNQIKQLQKGIIKDDTSFIYQLPFEKAKKHLLVQGYFSKYSHKNRAALDFKMKRGTTICSARDGIVTRIKEDGDKGGWNKKYRSFGNVIVIEHADGSRAGYWHLQFNGALVNVGDTVKQGKAIGLSGKTGYTLFPHLHFIVWRFNSNNQWQQVATRFQTFKGIKFLRPMRWYGNKY
jgi:murein DD-endopeptidase MepM/ murein hydrolase activator NlpD